MQASPAPCDLRGGPRELSARLGDASAQVGLLRQQVVALVEQRVRGSGDGGDDRLELHLVDVADDLPDDEDEERVSLQDAAKQLVSDDPFGGDDQGLLGDDRDEPEDGRDEEEEDQEPLPQVFFFPSGETTPITFTVRSRQDLDLEARRQMTALGKVRDPDRDEEEEALTAPDEKPDDSLIDDDFLED